MTSDRILVLGATGYVGSRLVQSLVENGYHVKASWRSKSKLNQCSWVRDRRVEAVEVDVFDLPSLVKACTDTEAVYYLVHSMYGGSDFSDADRRAAQNMVNVSKDSGIERIIYLGGLGDETDQLSKHLRSRTEVRNILSSANAPLTALRAAMIIGAGSASFEIMRYLVERLPVMTTPRWVRTRSQPIAISNVLRYLVGVLENRNTKGKTLDIGGPDILRYQDLMSIYAQEAKLPKRIVIPIPILTPHLSSYWVDLVTPVPASIARPLVGGLQNETICKNTEITELVPQKLLSARAAIRLALDELRYIMSGKTMTGMATRFIPEWTQPNDPAWAGGTLFHRTTRREVEATPQEVWHSVKTSQRLFGILNKYWRWRLIDTQPPQYLKLVSQLHAPLEITLELKVKQLRTGLTAVSQRIRAVPKGLAGFIYWHSSLPLHQYWWKRTFASISLV
ncbi:MAG: NAD(P)H-binding protein [Candidatus Thorarchaeota archaeon]